MSKNKKIPPIDCFYRGMYALAQDIIFLYRKKFKIYPFGVWLKYRSHKSCVVYLSWVYP